MAEPASDRPPFDAVLCDVDNVVRTFDSSGVTALERAAGLAVGTTAKIGFAPETVLPALRGEITPQEWVAAIAEGLAVLLEDETAAWELGSALLESPFRADETVVALLRRARIRVPVVLVSNAMLGLEADLDSLGLSDLADDVVNSARVGIAKPDPRIFHLAAARAGVRPQRCLFVDDAPENVEAATALGMRAVRYRGPTDLEEALRPLF